MLGSMVKTSMCCAPAGDGARNCVGARMAMLEAKLALVHLFRDHSYRLAPGQVPLKCRSALTFGPKDGVWLTVHERTESANLAGS